METSVKHAGEGSGRYESHHVVSETMTVSKLSPGIMCKKSSENSWKFGAC